MAGLKRRVDSHETLHQKAEQRDAATNKRVDVLTENTQAVVHLTATMNALIEALAVSSKIARGLLAVGAALTASWMGIKYAWNHL